jgi:hypothetical protein
MTLHGLIHLMGPAKAFGLADLPQLGQAIPRVWGVVWLAAALTMLAAAALLGVSSGAWRLVALVAVLLSQVAIATSWQDAKFGTVANLLILSGLAWISYASSATVPPGS